MRSMVEIHQTFLAVDLVSEVAYWMLSTLVVEAASVQQVWGRSLDAVDFLLVDQRPGVSSDSLIVGFHPSFLGVNAVVEIHQILFLRWISLQC